MELYLDSVDFKEIEAAFKWGVLSGLTTTPTFMHRHGITDIDGAIVKLSGMVPELQVEALGETTEEIVKEAHRLLKLPLKSKPVFKIPISNHGVQACRILTNEGHKVNIHLVYSLNQAYMAMIAGAAYICPLAGRMHDQGLDAFALYGQVVNVIKNYGYKSKVMVSSVRHPEHVRQGMLVGAHVCTAPWSVIKILNENSLTALGTSQFLEHTKLMTVKVKDVIRPHKSSVKISDTITDAMLVMTESGLGAVSVVDKDDNLKGIFTDGDLRRNLKETGKGILQSKMSDLKYKAPITINADALLYDAVNLFKQHQVDSIIVTENNKPAGFVDIQDLVKMGLIG
ncbi:MAG TPA: transaldolase family protein [Bacteroidia bacterium]|jgi:transaldolase|nr:transaldolase family protein [Bacteroidia bacterium]